MIVAGLEFTRTTRRPSGPQHPAGLGAGVVELAGLADDDRPGADDQHAAQVGPASASGRSLPSGRRTGRTGKPASCGPAAASGWYCTLKARDVEAAQALHDVVVQADVADLGPAERGVATAPSSGGVDGEPVVVRGDLDPAGGAVQHRLVDPAVAVARACRCRARAPGRAAGCRSRCRRAARRALEHARAAARPAGRRWPGRPGRWRRRRRPAPIASTSSMVASPAARAPRCRARPSARGHRLDAEVERGDGEPPLAQRRDDVRLAGGHLARGRRPAIGGAASTRASSSLACVGSSSPEKMPTRIAPRSRRCRVSARVSTPAMPTTPWRRARRRGSRRERQFDGPPGRVAHDVAGDPDPARLAVLVVHAGVADVRRGHHDDLAVVGGVGQRLLVAGHAGGEHGLAEGATPVAP